MTPGRTRGDAVIETVGGAMVRGLGALPASVAGRLAGRGRDLDGLQLDPHLALLLRLSDRVSPKEADATAAEQREQMRANTRLVAGRPLREPIAQHGPFVMNSSAEIFQAVEDFRAGRLA